MHKTLFSSINAEWCNPATVADLRHCCETGARFMIRLISSLDSHTLLAKCQPALSLTGARGGGTTPDYSLWSRGLLFARPLRQSVPRAPTNTQYGVLLNICQTTTEPPTLPCVVLLPISLALWRSPTECLSKPQTDLEALQ